MFEIEGQSTGLERRIHRLLHVLNLEEHSANGQENQALGHPASLADVVCGERLCPVGSGTGVEQGNKVPHLGSRPK